MQKSPAVVDESILRDVLGYLNFSSGSPDARFQRGLNAVFQSLEGANPRGELMRELLARLDEWKGTSAAFADVSQARAVIPLAFDGCVQRYRAHHRDLLFHLTDREFDQPFLLARMAEAVLAQGPPWSETDRVLGGAVDQLNDFLGFRPVAVLENGRKMQPYPHEAFRPVPLFLRDASVAAGPHFDLLTRALELFGELTVDIQRESYFDLDRMNELAVDVRAYDHLHPANKRTNYIFGEWDPHVIDNSGFYRRFVIRHIILNALLSWIDRDDDTPRDERLFDASAVLCGTILMASSISGSGPGMHDSTASLSHLLPRVARQRDLFYAHLLQTATGKRAKRLQREAKRTQQPFGHVRQHLNIELSRFGARQVHDRFLTQLYARMGFPDASREQAARIPCPAARFESEIGWRLTSAKRSLEHGDARQAAELLRETREQIHRGIDCGAIVDPWNILGFQGQFPLFQAREDAVPDQRVETLLEFMERYFDVASRGLSEASAAGDADSATMVLREFEGQAEWWDRFATTTISDLPHVQGGEALDSAKSVADALSQWRTAGESAGDISFWRQHVERFHSPQAYGRVVEMLLQKQDHVAAMGLLVQWLSQAEEVGVSSGGYSLSQMLLRWARAVADRADSEEAPGQDACATLRRMFDYVEANAGPFWSVPALGDAHRAGAATVEAGPDDDDFWFDDERDDDADDLYGAAYEGVVYRDSTDDGNFGDTVDEGYVPRDTEIELTSREVEPRIDFLKSLGELWQLAAAVYATRRDPLDADESERLLGWIRRAHQLQRGLGVLLSEVSDYEIAAPSGTADSNLEYDIQLQARLYLQHKIVLSTSELIAAEWMLRSLLPDGGRAAAESSAQTLRIATMVRCLSRGDVVTLRTELPSFLKALSKQPLLYVSLENDGDPRRFLAARSVQRVLSILLTNLPRLGLLHETWQVLVTAFRMERTSRPQGTATTEFDRLLRTAITCTLESAVRSTGRWRKTTAGVRRTMLMALLDGRRQTASALRSPSRRPSSSGTGPRPWRDASRRAHPGPRHFRGLPPSPCAPRRRARTARVAWTSVHASLTNSARRIPRSLAWTEVHATRAPRSSFISHPSSLILHPTLPIVKYLVERYVTLWLKHSGSVRLTPVEVLNEESRWRQVKEFIEAYGHDLLHAPMLMLSNIRAILHQGVSEFLDFLEQEQDPLHPVALIEDIADGRFDREEACQLLELVYETILDKLDRFVEYNTTTTQSDYGGMFYCLLEFLRVEAAYDRDAWNLRPFQMAHLVLAEHGSPTLAREWEDMLREKTRRKAAAHLKKLQAVEEAYSVRLPSVSDHIGERFVKVMAVHRMRALIDRALRESHEQAGVPLLDERRTDVSGDETQSGRPSSTAAAFLEFRREIDEYLKTTAGSAVEVPEWLSRLDREIRRHENDEGPPSSDPDAPPVIVAREQRPLRPRQMLRQLEKWKRKPR